MENIRKKQNKFGGYLLAESLIVLALLGVILTITLPAFVQFQKQQRLRSQRVELYRFAYELAQGAIIQEPDFPLEKQTERLSLSAKLTEVQGSIIKIEVSTEDEQQQFELVTKP